jgi:hypothetical protein
MLLAGQTWAQDSFWRANYRVDNIRNKAGVDFSDRIVYYLSGFSFDSYRTNDPNLTTVVQAEVRGIRNGIRNENGIGNRLNPRPVGSYSIIGHSQGGLRALAHISELRRQSDTASLRDLDAVITVSAINQGLPALEDGLAMFRRRAGEKVDIVGNGLRASLGIFDVFGTLAKTIPRNQLSNSLGFFMSIVPPNQRSYWAEAWVNPNPRTGVNEQIHDMVPKSQFITQNVVRAVDHTYRARTGQRLASEWRSKKVWPGITVWYLWVGMVNVYGVFTSPEVIPVFDASVPVGFIAGTNHNVLSMAAPNERAIRNGILCAEIGFTVAQGFHIVKNVAIIGLFTGGLSYERDANRARQLMANIDRELHDILRSSEGDGLVGLSSQYIPRTFRDPNTGVTRTNLRNPVLGRSALGYVRMFNNHSNIVENPETFRTARQMIEDGRILRGR